MKLTELVGVTFVDHNQEVISALTTTHGGQFRDCKFIIGNILKQPYGSLVSPTNSYGDMSGGIDLDYSERFLGLESRLQRHIQDYHSGKLKMGHAQIVPTHDERFPYLVASPTVEQPGDLATEKSVHDAMKAVLIETLLFNKKVKDERLQVCQIEKLLVPGLGTGNGGLDPLDAARAMRLGYYEVEQNLQHVLKYPDKYPNKCCVSFT